MATSDKHCQTNVKSPEISKTDRVYSQVMFDETVPVVNAREIESPPNSDDDEVVKSAMSKFNPPVRHTARHDFDSETESESEPEKFLDNASDEDLSPDRKPQRPSHTKNPDLKRHPSKESFVKSLSRQPTQDSSDNSGTDSNSPERGLRAARALSGRKRGAGAGVVIPAEGAYDPQAYQDLKVPADIAQIFQYILKYTPQKIDIEYKLQPFVPEYVPAVGDIDAFLKVTTPALGVRAQPLSDKLLEHIDNLGLTVLDEPAAEQSDSALLHLQLRAVSKISSAKATVLTKKVENAEKNPKAIDRWVKDVSELHLSKPAPNVNYMVKMPDIDSLMEEWPESVESALNDVGFPPASLDCSLAQYVDLTCGLFDIPVCGDTLNDRIQSLHVLFSLFSAVNNSQLFADREKEKKENV